MTAPPMYQPSWQQPQNQPQTQQQQTPQTPRPFAGRRRSATQNGQPNDGTLQQPQGAQQQPPQGQQSSGPSQPSAGGQQQPQARPTFAQMQQSGQARPAPPQSLGGFQGQLQSSISQQLSNPGRYGLPQVQQVNDALTNQTNQEFGAKQKQLDEEMSRRGVGSSSIAGGYMGDLGGQQANALASMRASLIQDAAHTNAQDQAAATGAGQAYLSGQQNYGLGQGALGVQQQQADTSRLGVQGNLDLGNRQLTQQGSQFNLQQALAEKLGVGNLDLQNRSLAQSGSQFDRSLAQSGDQFNQDLGLRSRGQSAQEAEFKQQLDQALGVAQMGDKTANRAVDANAALAQNDMMLKVMALLQQYGIMPPKTTTPTTPTTPTNPTNPTNPIIPPPPVDDPTIKTPIDETTRISRPAIPSRAPGTPTGGSTLGASTGNIQRPAQPPAYAPSFGGDSQSYSLGGGQPNQGYAPPGGFGTNTAGPQANGYPAAPPGFFNGYDDMLAKSKAALANGPQANGSQGTQYVDANGNPVSLEEGQRQTLAGRTTDATNTVNSWKNAGALFSDTMPAGQSMTGPDGKPVLPGGSMQDMIKQLLARYQGG